MKVVGLRSFLPRRDRGAVVAWCGWLSTGSAVVIAVLFRPDYPLLSLLSIGTGFSTAVLATWLQRRGRLSPIHPLSVAALTTIYPAFVVGSSLVASGLVRPWYLDRVVEPTRSLAIAQVLVVFGFGAAVVGAGSVRLLPEFFHLPTRWFDVRIDEEALTGFALYMIGMAAAVLGLLRGDYGYPAAYVSGTGTLILTVVSLQATGAVMVWRSWARAPTKRNKLLVLVLVALVPVQSALAASRATPVLAVAAAAFAVAQVRPVYSRNAVVFTTFAVAVALGTGVLFGTSLRAARSVQEQRGRIAYDPPGPGLLLAQTRGLERSGAAPATPLTTLGVPGSAVEVGSDGPTTTEPTASQVVARQARASGNALRTIADRGVAENATFLWRRLTDRLDHIASVAVFVGQYQDLRSQEAAYGLDHSLLKTLLSAPIPRALWKGKPVVSDGGAMGLLYFGNGSNSFTSTPMVELLRNGGWPAVLIGMAILGLLLALGHRALGSESRSPVAQALYATIVLRVVNYEAGYGTIFADGLRVVVVTVVAALVVRSVARWSRNFLHLGGRVR